MDQTRRHVLAPPRRTRWIIWLAYAACWTTALVAPMSDQPHWLITSLQIDLKFLVAKTAHVAGYGLFTVLAGWLRAPPRVRLLLLFLLMAHGTATELIQLFVEGRSGSLHDVAIDQVGIGLGLLLTWKWWRDPD